MAVNDEELKETPPLANCWPPMEWSDPAGHTGSPRSAASFTAARTSSTFDGWATLNISVGFKRDWTSFNIGMAILLRFHTAGNPKPR
jgi:hypothetical protein